MYSYTSHALTATGIPRLLLTIVPPSFFFNIFFYLNRALQDFQGASSAAAANAMRTELNRLISQVKDENERKVSYRFAS